MHPDPSWPFVAAPDHPILSALWEVFAHGSLGVLVVLPLFWRSPKRSSLVLLAFLGGVGLDIDHAVAARSIDPAVMEQLSQRPDTHSLLCVSLIAALALAATRKWLFAWGVFAVLSAHLLFDAPGGGVRWLFPFPHPESIPWLACPAGILLLIGISSIVMCSGESERRRRSARSLPDAHPVDDHARGESGSGVGRPRPVAADRQIEQ
jgi:membrane-bound metal-dependent hydrolase YbcI (DUF457 family)